MSLRIPVEGTAVRRIFSCCVCGVTAVNPTAVSVKFTIGKSAQIVVPAERQTVRQQLLFNVRVLLRKEPDARGERPVPPAGVILINPLTTK